MKPLSNEKLTAQEKIQTEALIRSTSNRTGRFIAIVAFLSGLGLMINVRLGVRLSLTELFTPFLFIAMSSGLGRLLTNRVVRNLIALVALNLIGIALSDTLNDVPFEDTLKGVAKPLFILLLFINFGLLFVQSVRFIIPLAFGLTAGAILHLGFNTADDLYDFSLNSMEYAFFVFRASHVVNLGTAMSAYFLYKWKPPLAVLPILAGTVVSVAYSGRSAIVVWLCATLAVVYCLRPYAINWWEVMHPRRKIFGFLIASFLLMNLSYFTYIQLVESEVFRMSEKQKANLRQIENDIGYGPVGLLMAGRAEVVGSILMILDEPIFGHGTSSNAGPYFVRAYRMAGQKNVVENQIDGILWGRITTGHSIFFHAWAANGILVVPLWIYIMVTIFRVLALLMLSKDAYVPLLIVPVIGLYWDIFFSPLSVQTRAWIPLALAFGAFYIPELQAKATHQLAILNSLNIRLRSRRQGWLQPVLPGTR
ncbi:MAG: hypothetical protein SGI77_18650 [Pirellulaceae bacterium]|nr:hypothetical protein [Pirellulaceae bacterium]